MDSMPKATMTLGGREVRVEINWNALSAFLADVGRDTLEGLSTISVMKPSEIPALMAAAINEGERLEGRESKMSALDVGALIKPADVTAFMNIYVEQSRAQMEEEPAKKKDEQQEQS